MRLDVVLLDGDERASNAVKPPIHAMTVNASGVKMKNTRQSM